MLVVDTGQRPRSWRWRRRAMIVAGLAACIIPLRAQANSKSLTFGLTPVFLSEDQKLLRLIRDYLQTNTGAPVELVQRRTYQEVTAMLLAGQIDAAWICGYPYVRHRDALSLVAVPVWRGRPYYQSYIISRSGRGAHTLAGLRGDIHAFSDPDSNSGYLVTQAALASLGSAPEAFFAQSFFTYGHRNVVRAVASGLAQSGSVDGYVWEALTVAEPALTAATEVVARSEWLGFPPVACLAARADTPAIRALGAALATMDADPAGRDVLDLLQLDGFSAAEPRLFDGIAALARSVGEAG